MLPVYYPREPIYSHVPYAVAYPGRGAEGASKNTNISGYVTVPIPKHIWESENQLVYRRFIEYENITS